MAETASTAASQYLKHPSFHRTFTLPPTADHEALEIGYSDLGRQPADSHVEPPPPVMLFMPGMFASRLHGVLMDVVGQKKGVRVLTVDRFGIGSSTNVPLAKRISIWTELVPKLLEKLCISHVSLVSHSAGTLYLLNTLYTCRDLLSPTRPYAVLMAPWVDVKHSGVTSMQAAQMLPDVALGFVDTFSRSIGTYIAPAVGSSLTFMENWFAGGSQPDLVSEEKRRYWQKEYGVSAEFLNTVLEAVVQDGFQESTIGINDEARLCLRKGGSWGECDDFTKFFGNLATLEMSRAQNPKLLIKILFAEQDSMIGQRGQQYMESCWRQNYCDGQDVPFVIATSTVEGTDHDGIAGKISVLEDVLGHLVD
ncbi:hypothetical protein V2A60_009480 [Cordyceps javanica]